MPLKTSLLSVRIFGNNDVGSPTKRSPTKLSPPASPTSCCSCSCHHQGSIFSTSRWLPRIRRRSSSASSTSTSSEPQMTAQQIALSYEKIDEFLQMVEFAEDELDYAFESRGSVYYHGDVESAQEAVASCLERYRSMLACASRAESARLDAQYRSIIYHLQARLDALPRDH